MPDSVVKIVQQMQRNPNNIDFPDLCKVCDYYFGKPRQDHSRHRIYKTPWPGDPRINIQNNKGKAKAYQVKQVLKAISKLEAQDGDKNR
ncbi:MAG: toxin HicA [Dehalococcoidia bacterium]|nr:toxin HicA [Dehalococcoidia bacterium]